MRLLIISHTPHASFEGKFYGWGPTVREINFLSNYFTITHIAPVKCFSEIPVSYSEVDTSIKLVPTRNRGGTGLTSKARVLLDSFLYFRLIIKYISRCDVVHVRCPANISLVALIALLFYGRKKKWIKYAGDWGPLVDFWSYKFQRFLIRNGLRNQVVTINGQYENERPFIHHILNPSYYRNEVVGSIPTKANISQRITLLFVGSLTPNKGADIVIDSLFWLREWPVAMKLYIVGDGVERDNLRRQVDSLGLTDRVVFEGWKSKQQLKIFYGDAHFILLPSKGEGWPKVISEAMSFGVVPIVSNVSGIERVLSRLQTGRTVPSFNPSCYAEVVKEYLKFPIKWENESLAAFAAAKAFTFESWIESLSGLFVSNWGIEYEIRERG